MNSFENEEKSQNERKNTLRQLEWLLEKSSITSHEKKIDYEPHYGDVSELNTSRLIMDSVGKDTLKEIAEDAIDLLGTSVAIYEVNGDYAFGMFSSGWCQLMDAASRKFCQTDDNRKALDCGCWLCHDNCWNDSAKPAIESGQSTDIQCVGGINMYGEPIYAGDRIVGAINIGYGNPPKEADRLKELAKAFDIDFEQLNKQALSYDSRPNFLLALAKNRLRTSAKLIGEIVEKAEAQKKLIKNESLFRGLYTNMTSGSVIYQVINDGSKGSDFIVTSFNQKSLEIEGKTLEQVVGKNLFELRPNIDDYGLIPVMKKVWKTGESAYFPVKIYQDEIFSNYYENYIFKIPTGEIVTIYDDVTDQKNTEEALRKSEERFALAIEFANDGLFDWNLESNEIYYSPVWKRMLGYENDELPNDVSAWEKLTHPEDFKRSWKMQKELINKQRDRFEVELRMKHKDGHLVDILARANAIFDENNKAVRLVGTHVDISERKKLESKLLQAQKMESLGTLTGGIAHDFNNLLYMIVGNTELALEDIPKWNPAYTNLEEIKSASLRAAGIVKQLLNFSRKADEKLISIDAVTVIKDSLKFLRSTIPTTVEIHEHMPDDEIIILSDSTQINQIMMNLCINAFQAMEETGGALKINIEKTICEAEEVKEFSDLAPGNCLKITVSDTGPGISPEIINRIYDPYFTTKEMGKGSGMGLSIIHGIVKNHGGAIRVDSSLGNGTTFTLLFPMVEEKPVNETETIDKIPRGHETILFVDDDESITGMTQKMLKRLGYKIETSLNPLQALDLFQSKPDSFDLVITDMTMPQMTGAKLSEKLMEIRSDIPIIICTGHSSLIDEEKAKKFGIAGYIMKPASISTIANVIRKVLDK